MANITLFAQVVRLIPREIIQRLVYPSVVRGCAPPTDGYDASNLYEVLSYQSDRSG